MKQGFFLGGSQKDYEKLNINFHAQTKKVTSCVDELREEEKRDQLISRHSSIERQSQNSPNKKKKKKEKTPPRTSYAWEKKPLFGSYKQKSIDEDDL